jgi:hypothetical protein
LDVAVSLARMFSNRDKTTRSKSEKKKPLKLVLA